MRIEDIGEFGLIDRIRKRTKIGRGVRLGIGDDAAVLERPGRSEVLLLTVDTVVEDVHFSRGTPERLVGRKALARALSDIAAMGGIPRYAVVSLGLPRQTPVKSVDLFYEGFLKLAKEYEISLVGGDVTRSQRGLFVSVAVLGEARKDKIALRKGARPGDLLFVTGALGGSMAGRHLRFQPRIQEGAWLVQSGIPSAMIDISDGLIGDLKHLLEESRVGACLFSSKIPVSKAARDLGSGSSESALKRALWEGEDYELLFSAGRKSVSWMRRFERQFHISVSCIGRVVKGPPRIFLEEKNARKKEITEKGFTHF